MGQGLRSLILAVKLEEIDSNLLRMDVELVNRNLLD